MNRTSIQKIIVGTAVLAVLVLLGTYLLGGFEGLSANGIGAVILGVTASLALGIGLMTAIFASSRGHDDRAHYAAMDQFKKGDHERHEPAARQAESSCCEEGDPR